jgi:thiol-disulfide isomerase/thioredoxin
MAEMKAIASKEIFGSVTQISKTDWQTDVTDASKNVWVVVHLFQNHLPACKLINAHLDTLARKYRATKFLKIVADQCIPNYPDKNCPTVIIYGNGDIRANLVGTSQLGGINARVGDLETILGRVGAIEIKPKEEEEIEEEVAAKIKVTRMAKGTDDSDDDWD